MSIYLPKIDIFQEKIILQQYSGEKQDGIIQPIILGNHLQSAKYMAKVGADNQLEFCIDEILHRSSDFKEWRKHMPSTIPKSISNYQNRYPNYNMIDVNDEINKIGCKLSAGQTLVHGGLWYSDSNIIKTDRLLSTTFCPQVALRNAEWHGKAYDNGRIDIMVLTVVNPKTNVYVFKQRGSNKGHEKEILFASGAILTKVKEHYIHQILAHKWGCPDKEIPIYVLEINIS